MASAEGLFTAHRDRVLRYLSRMVGQPEARDLTQEVFLRVTRTPVPGDSDEAQRAWIFRIARNLALNHLRDRHRRPTNVALQDRTGPPNQELAVTLESALARLAPADREIFCFARPPGFATTRLLMRAACHQTPSARASIAHASSCAWISKVRSGTSARQE